MKYGLVELCVNVEGIRAARATEAVRLAITRDPDGRAAAVRAALDRARDLGCGFVVFPGWTLVAHAPPLWLLDLSAGITVVAEMLFPDANTGGAAPRKGARESAPARAVKGERLATDSDRPAWAAWDGFVIRDGRVVVGPCAQQVAEAPELWDGDKLSPTGARLVGCLAAHGSGGRQWEEPGVGGAMLVMCGEANVVGGGGPAECYQWDAVEAAGLTVEGLGRVRCVANPAHTASGPQALRDKRAWLSRGGVLLHTANTHGGGWQQERHGEATSGRASYGAARAWVRGEQQELKRHDGNGYAVVTFDGSP